MRQKKPIIILFVLITTKIFSFGQSGKIVLIGGGMERSGSSSWNYQLFSRIVNQAANKRVLVIGHSAGDGWLEQNFVSTWGASFSKELVISSANANLQQTYDTIITYNAIYFRGGDQYYYYNYIKNTKTSQALQYVYNHGGVIAGTSAGMHILSEIIFTDDTGYGIYPYEAIQNPNHPNITLHNDLFSFLPGIISDSHFAERGRFGRLLGFMAKHKFTTNQNIIGIGVDDLTAIFIDQNKVGAVYGTGAVNIYVAQDNSFSTNPPANGKLLAENVRVIQLIQGCTINLNTLTIIQNPPNEFNSNFDLSFGNYTVYASYGNPLSENGNLLQEISILSIPPTTTKLILTQSDQTLANQYKASLESLGVTNIVVKSALASNGSNAELNNLISSASLYLFVNNNFNEFNQFLGTPNGTLLKTRLTQSDNVKVFIGDNSRFAGKIVVEKYLTSSSSYYGEMEFYEGLNLIKSSVIMPNTYLNTNVYENTVTAVPYAMVNQQLKYGVWLTPKNYLKYYVSNNKAFLISKGQTPLMILKNEAQYHGNSTQTSTGSGTPRQIAGFDRMRLDLIDETTPYNLGDVFTNIDNINLLPTVQCYPNPATSILTIQSFEIINRIEIFNLSGRMIVFREPFAASHTIDLSNLEQGTYLVRIIGGKSTCVQKVAITR